MAEDVVDSDYDQELRQFLEADLLPQVGDPVFKARLRDHLLALLRAQRDGPWTSTEAPTRAPGPSADTASEVDRMPQPTPPRPAGGDREPR